MYPNISVFISRTNFSKKLSNIEDIEYNLPGHSTLYFNFVSLCKCYCTTCEQELSIVLED